METKRLIAATALGAVSGLIVGLPFPFFDIIIGQKCYVAGAAFLMGPVFGLFIEYFTTKVFNAPRIKSVYTEV